MTGNLAITPNLNAIHKHTLNTCGYQLRFLESCTIYNRSRVKQNQVGFEARLNTTTIL